MCGLLTGHFAQRPRAKSAQQGVSLKVLHVHGVQQTAVHGRGALRHRRKQICVQRGLHERKRYQRGQFKLR